MFLGEHHHTLDVKGRVILPSKFRELLEDSYVTSETDGCLALWPPAEFERKALEIRERAATGEEGRNVARFFFSGAQPASPDRQGRVALPTNLRDFAHLDREVVVNGAFDHVEIWDAVTWQAKKALGERGLASPSPSPAVA